MAAFQFSPETRGSMTSYDFLSAVLGRLFISKQFKAKFDTVLFHSRDRTPPMEYAKIGERIKDKKNKKIDQLIFDTAFAGVWEILSMNTTGNPVGSPIAPFLALESSQSVGDGRDATYRMGYGEACERVRAAGKTAELRRKYCEEHLPSQLLGLIIHSLGAEFMVEGSSPPKDDSQQHGMRVIENRGNGNMTIRLPL